MNSAKQDFYKTLGVIDSAELAVIKAAYKALMQIYHPDKYIGDKVKAVRMSKEINEAYAILIDPVKRKKYDDERSARKDQYEPEQAKDEFTNARNDVLEADWNIAIEHVKGLEALFQKLNKLSQDLAFTFKLDILESKRFEDADGIAEVFEKEFLMKFFGVNRLLQEFAGSLLKEGKREIAKELNRAVVVLGNSIDTNSVIKTIIKKYKLDQGHEFSPNIYQKYTDGSPAKEPPIQSPSIIGFLFYAAISVLAILWVYSLIKQ